MRTNKRVPYGVLRKGKLEMGEDRVQGGMMVSGVNHEPGFGAREAGLGWLAGWLSVCIQHVRTHKPGWKVS